MVDADRDVYYEFLNVKRFFNYPQGCEFFDTS